MPGYKYQSKAVFSDDVRRRPSEGAAAGNLAGPPGVDRQELRFTRVLGAIHGNALLELPTQLLEPPMNLGKRLELVGALEGLAAADALWQRPLLHLSYKAHADNLCLLTPFKRQEEFQT